MSDRRRWWKGDGLSIDIERGWFEQAGLDFKLDEQLFDETQTVVFVGQLRLGENRTEARVVYPPSYGAGGHPQLMADALPIGRHRTPDGLLCLDHPVFGATQPMCGAEAVERAERLWDLWENDREQLRKEEADAPDPAANYYGYERGGGITMLDVDVTGATKGYFRVHASSLGPLRGAITEVRVTHPHAETMTAAPVAYELGGGVEINGAWVRIDSPPPPDMQELGAWLEKEHEALVIQRGKFAHQEGRGLPALLAFVYPDEGPARDELHDAWLFLSANLSDGAVRLARTFHLRQEHRGLRQPQLAGLEAKNVAVIGAGALGSQIIDLLAKAGVGDLLIVDGDHLTHGNRVRHQLDLADLGLNKAQGLAARVRRVNPWAKVEAVDGQLGVGFGGDPHATVQDDLLFARLSSVDLIVNATVDHVAGSYLSAIGAEATKPVLHAWVNAGAWGGRVLLQRQGAACWDCLALAQEHPEEYEAAAEVPAEPSDPDAQEVAEEGCAHPTFTGPGFELTSAAAAAARAAVQLLLANDGGYPSADFDLITMQFRGADSARPSASYTSLPPHPSCTTCTP